MADAGEDKISLEFTPTWAAALVCFSIVSISILFDKLLRCTGQLLEKYGKWMFVGALQKVKDELMVMGSISLLLAVFQPRVRKICIPEQLAYAWLPCKKPDPYSTVAEASNTTVYCSQKGKVPLLSLEALHHLDIFIFALATTHVILCVFKVLLGYAVIHRWRKWVKDDPWSTHIENRKSGDVEFILLKQELDKGSDDCIEGFITDIGNKPAVLAWMISFFKQFYPSVTKFEYLALRLNYFMAHNEDPKEDFQNYIVEKDFKKMVGIRWYLWLLAGIFLLVNVAGWHAYFWISFVPLILLLIVGTKLEHTITQQANEVAKNSKGKKNPNLADFSHNCWFSWPHILRNLIHIVLFGNSLELAFFFFIWLQYDFRSCIMGKVGFVVTRIAVGVFVQFMCICRTIPLYAIVRSSMHSRKEGDKQDRTSHDLEKTGMHLKENQTDEWIEKRLDEIKTQLKEHQSGENQSGNWIEKCLDDLVEIKKRLKKKETVKEGEMWIVTWISKWIDKRKNKNGGGCKH